MKIRSALKTCFYVVSVFPVLLFRKKRKINIGASKNGFEGEWFNCDIDILNILKKKDWYWLLFFLKVDNIFAEHVWEHIGIEDILPANKNCHHFLRKNGVLRIAVPDGYHPDKNYIDYVKPGGTGDGADDHKNLFNYRSLGKTLENAGFKIKPMEYWDENGEFHFTDWPDEGGKVMRSRRYDWRNTKGELNYTSLIIDAVKV